MRITVYDALGSLATGMTSDDFPELTHEDIAACLAPAADPRQSVVLKAS